MPPPSFLATIALIAAAPVAGPGPAPSAARPDSIVLRTDSGQTILVEVEGQPMRLRVEPSIGKPILNPGAAARAGLTGSPRAIGRLGRMLLDGRASEARIAINGRQRRREVTWFDQDIVAGADGLIGIAGLPYEAVILQLGPESRGELRYDFKMKADAGDGLVFRQRVGGRTIDVLFRSWMTLSRANASAGGHLARVQGGTWTGKAVQRPIVLGLSRPLRPMQLHPPLSLNGFRVERLFVRTAEESAAVEGAAPGDPEEIVVTAAGARLTITLGGDRLAACSSIAYHKRGRRLTLQCPPD